LSDVLRSSFRYSICLALSTRVADWELSTRYRVVRVVRLGTAPVLGALFVAQDGLGNDVVAKVAGVLKGASPVTDTCIG
jgi:hypothetical protein